MRTLLALVFLTILITSSTISTTVSSENKNFFYCIQVMSTENPQLLKPPYFNDAYGEAMVEEAMVNGRKYYRIIFIFVDLESQEKAFIKWKQQYKDAIKITRTEKQIMKMYPLFHKE